jgi:hypothetical protein
MTTLPPDSSPPPVVPNPVDRDAEHLRILSICWYILAALQALGGCVAMFYVVFGLAFGLLIASSGKSDDAAAGGVFGGFFVCLGVFILLLVWGLAFLNYKVGQSLALRKNSTLCMVMAILCCMWIPIGTLLGVFTLVVLSRPAVKASFA